MPDIVAIQTVPSEAEKARALDLVRHRKCPHCQASIKLSDAISMVQGAGYAGSVRVETEGGFKMVLPIAEVNPQTMGVIDSD